MTGIDFGSAGIPAKIKLTPDGGFAVLLTNKTGSGLAKYVLHFN